MRKPRTFKTGSSRSVNKTRLMTAGGQEAQLHARGVRRSIVQRLNHNGIKQDRDGIQQQINKVIAGGWTHHRDFCHMANYTQQVLVRSNAEY
jgi:hypothetical protein